MMTDVVPMRAGWERQGTWERAAWQVAVLAGELGLELASLQQNRGNSR